MLVSSDLILFTGFSFSGKAFKVSVNGESVSLRLRIFLKLYNEKSFGDGYLPVYTAPSVSVIFCYIVGGKDNTKNSLHWGFKFYFLKFVEHIMWFIFTFPHVQQICIMTEGFLAMLYR